MELYDGLNLRPLFYSEISSSYLIFQIFESHSEIAKAFAGIFLGLDVGGMEVTVARERSYRGKGSIDLLLVFKSPGKMMHVLVEVKVHDYASATPGQIRTYFEAALEETANAEIHFVYLTQFSRKNFDGGCSVATPPTILECEEARQMKEYGDRISHVNWQEFHSFMDTFRDILGAEQRMMLDLQRTWMKAESENDLNTNRIMLGDRNIADYFPDVTFDIEKELAFGKSMSKNRRVVLSIDLVSCSESQHDKILSVIAGFLGSKSVDQTVVRKTEEYTLAGAKEYLADLARDETNWRMLSFYSSLFYMVNTTDYAFFNGTGSRGFSIKVGIKGRGEISLCTLWANKTVEFSLMR